MGIQIQEIPLEIRTNGLSSGSVTKMREQQGRNELSPPERTPLYRQYLAKYHDPIIQILIIATVLSALVSVSEGSSLVDTLGIIAAVILATSISFLTEYKSNREFEALNAMRDDTRVKVVRDGMLTNVPMRDIVVYDLIFLEAGDAVPADGLLIHDRDLEIDESAFTGESEPARKKTGDAVRKGTYVLSGSGRMITTAVGDRTEMGAIASSLAAGTRPETPLQTKLQVLAGQVSRFGYLMAGLIIIAVLVKGLFSGAYGSLLDSVRYILNGLMLAVVIIVVSVPEGLPVSVTISLALTMKKMTRAYSLVRRLIACETIGAVTVICTDKTGTLTMNQMEVTTSEIIPELRHSIPVSTAEWITLNAAVNSTASLEDRAGTLQTVGNSTEAALLRWLVKAGVNYQQVRADNPVLSGKPFSSQTKQMSSIIARGEKQFLLVKGAPQILAARSFPPPDLSPVATLAGKAMRTLAFAHAEITSSNTDLPLVWDGYVGIRDEIRPDVPNAVSTCRKAGIQTKMVTGDSAETAEAIAREIGILEHGLVMTGEEFRTLPEEERMAVSRDLEVLARSDPHDKLLLVQALQKRGEVVAVTGDGTNDAPALRNADVGLAMGIAGTEVAREASDIILLDDSFPTIQRAVWWGRALYENIQRFLIFQLTINISAAVLSFLVPLLGYPAPFTIIQLLWINIIMDSLAALALCSESPHPALMDRQPIPRDKPILTRYMIRVILITAALYILAGMVAIRYGIPFVSADEQTTVFFTAFVLAQFWNGINCRAMNGIMPSFFRGNPLFFVIMGGIILVQIIIVQFGGALFGTVPLTPALWIGIFFLTASILLLQPVLRIIGRHSGE